MLVRAVVLTLAMLGDAPAEPPPIQRPTIQRPTPQPTPPSQPAPGPGEGGDQSELQPTEPAPAEPAPTEPTPTDEVTAPTEPPVEPAPAEPAPTDPEPGGVPTPPSLPPVPGETDTPADVPAETTPVTTPPSSSPSSSTPIGVTPPPVGETTDTVSPFDVRPDVMQRTDDDNPLPPPPPPPPPAPPDGQGFLVVSAILGSTGLLIRLWTTIAALRASGGSTADHVNVVTLGSFFYTPFIAGGMVTAGFGFGRRGHYDAYSDRYKGDKSIRKNRAWLGWGLFTAGMAVWTATRGYGCVSSSCFFRTSETGYYLSLAATIPGIIFGSYGSGYAHYRKRNRSMARARLSPMGGPRQAGVMLSAEF